MERLVIALGPVFAAGFAAQQLLEILAPLVTKIKWNKKITLGIISMGFGFMLSFGAGLRVLEPLGVVNAGLWDAVVSGLIVSAGTEGINSVMKFLGYAKEKEHEKAGGQVPQDNQDRPKQPKFAVR